MLQRSPTARPFLLRGLIGLALVISASLLALWMPAWSQAGKTDAGASQQKRQALLPAQIHYGTDALPRPVLDLREALQGAVEAGRIEELLVAYQEAAIKPDLGAPPKSDPLVHWKGISGDGEGRDVLAALSLILETGYAEVRRGADIENNKLYVWPYFAEMPLDKLTPRQEVELLRLVPASAMREMKAKGKYTHWRLVIGADGTWHALRKGE